MDYQLGRNNKLLRSSATKERVLLSSMSSTEAVYNPNFEVGMVRLDRGMAVLEKQLSRDKLPSGKPLKGPNLVAMPPQNGLSVDPVKVVDAYSQLGHH